MSTSRNIALTTAQINALTLGSISSNPTSGPVVPLNSSAAGIANPPGGLVQAPLSRTAKSLAIGIVASQAARALAPELRDVAQISRITAGISATIAEFSRVSFASALASPLVAAMALRNLICTGIKLVATAINALVNISFPLSLPGGLASFNPIKLITKLVIAVEKIIWNLISNAVKAILNAVLSIIKRFYAAIINIIKLFFSLFNCNPGDRR